MSYKPTETAHGGASIALVHGSVVMSPVHAKAFAQALSKAMRIRRRLARSTQKIWIKIQRWHKQPPNLCDSLTIRAAAGHVPRVPERLRVLRGIFDGESVHCNQPCIDPVDGCDMNTAFCRGQKPHRLLKPFVSSLHVQSLRSRKRHSSLWNSNCTLPQLVVRCRLSLPDGTLLILCPQRFLLSIVTVLSLATATGANQISRGRSRHDL